MKIKRLAKNVPVVGQAYGIIETVKKVSTVTDPVEALVLAGEMIVEDCLPPQVKYPVECAIFLAECSVVVYSAVAAPLTGGFSLSICLALAKRIIMRRL